MTLINKEYNIRKTKAVSIFVTRLLILYLVDYLAMLSVFSSTRAMMQSS